MKYGVYMTTNGHPSDEPVSTHDEKPEAIAKASRMRGRLSPGEKSHYKISFRTITIKD